MAVTDAQSETKLAFPPSISLQIRPENLGVRMSGGTK